MITTDMTQFESDAFAMQLLSKGSFIDIVNVIGGSQKLYQIDTYTLRLNYVASSEHLYLSHSKCPDDFETREEYEAQEAERKARLDAWRNRVMDDLHISVADGQGSVAVNRVASEVFCVVHIRQVGIVRAEPEEAQQ